MDRRENDIAIYSFFFDKWPKQPPTAHPSAPLLFSPVRGGNFTTKPTPVSKRISGKKKAHDIASPSAQMFDC
jgi:hypothetical protein